MSTGYMNNEHTHSYEASGNRPCSRQSSFVEYHQISNLHVVLTTVRINNPIVVHFQTEPFAKNYISDMQLVEDVISHCIFVPSPTTKPSTTRPKEFYEYISLLLQGERKFTTYKENARIVYTRKMAVTVQRTRTRSTALIAKS